MGAVSSWANLAAGDGEQVCATRTNGTLWCWGVNWYRQLGQGDYADRTTPTQVGALTTWRHVFLGVSHACATRADRTAWCWGNNGAGQLGTADFNNRTTPTQLSTTGDILSTGPTANHILLIG